MTAPTLNKRSRTSARRWTPTTEIVEALPRDRVIAFKDRQRGVLVHRIYREVGFAERASTMGYHHDRGAEPIWRQDLTAIQIEIPIEKRMRIDLHVRYVTPDPDDPVISQVKYAAVKLPDGRFQLIQNWTNKRRYR